jgi:hypothetical protein
MARNAGRLSLFDAVGCGKCEGWLALEQKPIPDGMIRVYDFYAVAGFHGFKTWKATEEERKTVARARFIRDFAIGVTPPTSFSKQWSLAIP